MNDRATDVANAIVALLNGTPAQAVFAPLAFTSVRAYQPLYDLTSLTAQGLKVTVMAKAVESIPLQRNIVEDRVQVDVAVQNKVSQDPVQQLADCDPLMTLMQQIKETVEPAGAVVLADNPKDCGWQGTANDPLYDPTHLTQNSVFTSITTFLFLTRRAR